MISAHPSVDGEPCRALAGGLKHRYMSREWNALDGPKLVLWRVSKSCLPSKEVCLRVVTSE
jgi:hypothetical protein